MDGDGDGDGHGHDDAPAEHAKLSRAAVPGRRRKRLSDLPNDLLVSILLRLNRLDSAAATRTSALSSRWRGLWAQLPSLSFLCFSPDCARVHAALAARARAAPVICRLTVSYFSDAAPDATASWLRLAVPLLSGELYFNNRLHVGHDYLERELAAVGIVERGTFELPCFKKATKICFHLGFLGLALPPSCVFDKLRVLRLERVLFQGQFVLGDTMWPSLRSLLISKTRGLVDLALSSKSLEWMNLTELRGLQRLNVEARSLKVLCVAACLRRNLQFANITVERLEELRWVDFYDPTLVKFGVMPGLRQLSVFHFSPYGRQGLHFNRDRLRILKHFSSIHHLQLLIVIQFDLSNMQATMKGITSLPDIEILSLLFSTHGHVFGPSVLHLLTMCTGIRELSLTLPEDSKVGNACPLNCICDQPPSWRTRDILMKVLEKVEIFNFTGEEHEVDFVKLLFRAAPALKRMRVTCHRSFAAWEKLSEDLQSLASEEISVEVTSPLPSR